MHQAAADRFTAEDHAFMRRALALAERGRGRVSPNPLVGCVLVRGGCVVGEGYHQKAGTPHAEVHALRQAGDLARGATAYVTLEPCSHHGRTPPCADALIQAGVGRVVAAMADPNPLVSGRGLERLRAAGITAEAGLLAAEAQQLNEIFVKFITTRRPFVWMKAALTLDGKIATHAGDSRWVSGVAARTEVHRLRDQLDAVLVGVGTVLADDPQLTVRLWPGGRNPIRVVADSLARTPPASRVLSGCPETRTIIAATPAAPLDRLSALRAAGAEILVVPPAPGASRVFLPALLDELGRREITSVLLEGGAELNAAALAAGLVDKFSFFFAPKIAGGRHAPGPVGGDGVELMADAYPLRIHGVRALDPDLLVEAYPDVHRNH